MEVSDSSPPGVILSHVPHPSSYFSGAQNCSKVIQGYSNLKSNSKQYGDVQVIPKFSASALIFIVWYSALLHVLLWLRSQHIFKKQPSTALFHSWSSWYTECLVNDLGGGPRVVVSTAAFHARVRGSVPGLGCLKETKLFLPHPRVKVSIVGSLRDREVAYSASDSQGSNFESCVGGQCHLNHLTILRRFSWPSLAYMCTKMA